MDSEKYPGSSTLRPKKILKGGKGVYCCIPECKSRFYNSDMTKTGIGFFTLPKDTKTNHKWKRIIRHYRRWGAKDKFKITPGTVVCEFHFETKDIKVSLGRGRKTVRKGAVPKLFSFKKPRTPSKRKSPKKRLTRIFQNDLIDHVPDPVPIPSELEPTNDIEQNEIKELKQRIEELENENLSLKNQVEELKKNDYNYKNLSQDESFFKSETGLTLDGFSEVLSLLDIKENCENIKYYEAKLKGSDITSPTEQYVLSI